MRAVLTFAADWLDHEAVRRVRARLAERRQIVQLLPALRSPAL